MFKVSNKDTWCHSGVFIVNLKHILPCVSIVNFEHVNAGWVSFVLE